MPHVIIEYTDNLNEDINISTLLNQVNQSLLQHREIIPIAGLRTRAVELNHYCVADGVENDAFVHVTLKLGSGRTNAQIKKVCDGLFETLNEYFSVLFNTRYLALSLEVYEFTRPTYKQNNIHLRYT